MLAEIRSDVKASYDALLALREEFGSWEWPEFWPRFDEAVELLK
jgi:hypothetical protein